MARFTWQRPGGVPVVFDEAHGVRLLVAVEGLGAPPSRRTEVPRPLAPGSRLGDVQDDVREVHLPVMFLGLQAALEQSLRDWATRLDPGAGDGLLKVDTELTTRWLSCRLSGGLEVLEAGLDVARVVDLVFRAVDPYWQSAARSSTFTSADGAGWFPIFPLRLASSTIFAEASVANPGDVAAWPVWTITGPGSDPLLSNSSTGQALEFDGLTLGAGDTVVVDTRPGFKTVIDGDGVSRFDLLTPESDLWALAPGSTALQIALAGSDATSSVRLAYNPRYRTV